MHWADNWNKVEDTYLCSLFDYLSYLYGMSMYVYTHKNLFFELNIFILKARYSHVRINFFNKSLILSFICVQIKNIEKRSAY